MIIRVTNTEYETDDGVVAQLPIELDYIPSVEEFQEMYNEWFRIFQQKGLIKDGK